MDSERHRQRGVVENVINGSIRIEAPGEFMGLVKMFPQDPDLHRVFGDWLLQNRKTASAIQTYRRAVGLFINDGKLLQAISTKLMEWSVSKPTYQGLSDFYSQVHKSHPEKAPVHQFFTDLGYHELVNLLSAMTLVKVPPGKTAKKFGAAESYLFFIASGTMQRTLFLPVTVGGAVGSGEAETLKKDAFFGEIFPFEQEIISQSFIRSITPVELIRIPKDRLSKICRRHPNMHRAVKRLFNTRIRSQEKLDPSTLRKVGRRLIDLKLTVDLPRAGGDDSPAVYEGHSIDIGIGGLSVALHVADLESLPKDITGKRARVNISLPDDSVAMTVRGTIVWTQLVEMDGAPVPVLGVQFEKMTPQMSGYLVVFTEIVSGMAT